VTTDFDNDGVADISGQRQALLEDSQRNRRRLVPVRQCNLGIADVSAASIDDGLCFGDIDADGDLDIVAYTSISEQRRFASIAMTCLAQLLRVVCWVRAATGRGRPKIRVYAPGGSSLLWYEEVAIYDSQAGRQLLRFARHGTALRAGPAPDRGRQCRVLPSRRLVWKRGVNANEMVKIHEPSAEEQTRRPQ